MRIQTLYALFRCDAWLSYYLEQGAARHASVFRITDGSRVNFRVNSLPNFCVQ